MTKEHFEKGKGKTHLDKEFLEELKHKMWSTKGSRFNASQRIKSKERYSLLSISFLSAYLIIFGLLSVYDLYSLENLPQNLLPFSITILSILLLVFSLFENSKNYSIRALQFHNCSLEIAQLYNELQIFKSYRKENSDTEKEEFSKSTQSKYQKILKNYENHLRIDNNKFKMGHPDYYHIEWYEWIAFPLMNFIMTYLIYLILMITPGIFLIFILTKS